MEHTHIVKDVDLDRYASTRESEEVIPELVRHLIKQSARGILDCRIPYGDAVNQPGLDGLLEVEEAFLEFVPKGKSYWEIGTGAKPQNKATQDFGKRTKQLSNEDRSSAAFVFVTPRSSGVDGWSEPSQSAWLKDRKSSGWGRILILDGVRLAEWMREFPAVGKWMAKKMGLSSSLGAFVTPLEHWQNLESERGANDPPIPPQLFTVGRTNVGDALRKLFEIGGQRLFLFAESSDDVADFVAAYIQTLGEDLSRDFGNRCLIVTEADAWRSVVELRSSHVLVGSVRLGLDLEENASLLSIAKRKSHSVVVPICGAWTHENPETIKLRSPSQHQIEKELRKANYSEARSRELAGRGAGRISALKRFLQGFNGLPPYATWQNAHRLAEAGLLGGWNGSNLDDRAAIEAFLGKPYGDWILPIRQDAIRTDSPLVQQDEHWRIVGRLEAWISLGKDLSDDQLDRFIDTVALVLGERNPMFDLPKEEHFAASIHGKSLKYSKNLRQGLAETLALLGSHPRSLTSCSSGKAEVTALLAVRRLLTDATWVRWASLNSYLPLLAEAAPDEFLDAVESALVDLENTPFRDIFALEGPGGAMGSNFMTGLLWALEGLAWNGDFLSRVSVILADLASIDPGGNWTNRPANSLADIFLPWHVQTVASIESREDAIRAVIDEQPEVGWKLLLALLPHNHGFTTGCYKPVWRDYIPADWSCEVTRRDYHMQVDALSNMAFDLAKNDLEKLSELFERFDDFTHNGRKRLLDLFASDEMAALPEEDRLSLWETMVKFVIRHRKFSGADWALPEVVLQDIEASFAKLTPSSEAARGLHLFANSAHDLMEEKGSYDEQRKRLDKRRQGVVASILDTGEIGVLLAYAEKVAAPFEVGRAFAGVATSEQEAEILPEKLGSPKEVVAAFIAGYVWVRFWLCKWDWVDLLMTKGWSASQKNAFLLLLPFGQDLWRRVETQLGADEGMYWKSVTVNPYGLDIDKSYAVEKLLQYGRPGDAVSCACVNADEGNFFDARLAIRALLAVLEVPDEVVKLDRYSVVQAIGRLQSSPDVDADALFRIEWNFLRWLDRFSSGSPVTLEKRLASNPSFFWEAVSLVFRSKKSDKIEVVDEQRRSAAQNAYRLLTEWKRCPGTLDDGSFDPTQFRSWLDEALRLSKESGHEAVAMIQIGHMLASSPPDPEGLWIHKVIAAALNDRRAAHMRSGFTTELFNRRGVHGFSAGNEERKLAQFYRERSEALNAKGFTRFATAIRGLAEGYDRDAERESKRNPFDD